MSEKNSDSLSTDDLNNHLKEFNSKLSLIRRSL